MKKNSKALIDDRLVATNQKPRIEWVDTARGLGILIVVIEHLIVNIVSSSEISRAIESFHMPMFFVLSGFLAHKLDISTGTFIKKKARELLIPFAIFVLGSLPIDIYIAVVINKNTSLISMLKMMFFVDGFVGYNAPIWFLIVMFQVVIIFNIIKACNFSLIVKIFSALFCFLSGYIVYTYHIHLLFGFEKTLIGLGFYFVGNIFSMQIKLLKSKGFVISIVLISTIVWFIFGCLLNPKISLYYLKLCNYWMFIISGITGSIMWFGLSYLLKKIKIFQKWGKNTIFILGTHYIGIAIVKLLNLSVYLPNKIYLIIVLILIGILAMFAYMPICKFVNKYIPILNGKKRPAKFSE